MKRTICTHSFLFLAFILVLSGKTSAQGQWGVAPTDWGDFAIGLTDDATHLPDISTAVGAGTELQYRVRYINQGVDIATNWYSWATGGGSIVTNFIAASDALGMKSAFNIYMLQEDGGADVAIANMASLSYMQKYFWNIRDVAQKANGTGSTFIIEPDTWGYLIKKNYGAGPTSAGGDPTIRPNMVFAHVNDLGYPHLAGLPNTMAGVAQGIILTIRTFAPDAHIGFHTNHWATWSNGATASPCLGASAAGIFYQCQAGMPFWSYDDIDVNADFQIEWYEELLGGASACDKGDFLVVEKYGFDEGGRWVAFGAAASVLYYGNTEYEKWLYWSKKMGQGLNLPLLGWQIPIGNSSLPNTMQKYKDGMMENFFANRANYICSGFIGLFMGPGVGASTYYRNAAGVTGDDGWLFSNLRSSLDPFRPINMNVTSNGCGLTSSPTSGCTLPLNLLDFNAESVDEYASVTWTTSEEYNVSHFTLLKSTDGIHFTEINRTEASNSLYSNHYFYNDYSISYSEIYYQLIMTDIDGGIQKSAVIVLYDSDKTTAEIYPNPASSFIHILFKSSEKEGVLKLIDIHGRGVLTTTISKGDNLVPIETLPSSLYLYQVIDISGTEIVTGKLRIE